jgi:putative transposase
MQWVEIEQVAELENKTARWIRKQCQDGIYKEEHIKIETGKGIHGGKKIYVSFDALTPRAQFRYLNNMKDKPIQGAGWLVGLEDWQIKRFNERVRIVHEIAAFPKAWKGRMEAFQALAEKENMSYMNLTRYWKKYRENGLQGLVPKRRSGAGCTMIPEEMQTLIYNLYFYESAPSIKQVQRAMDAHCATYNIERVSYTRIHNYLKGCEQRNPMDAFARRYGIRAARQKFGVYIPRDFSYLKPNDLWMGDHHLLDILVINPKTGKPDRPWITTWLDVATRTCPGYHLSFQPSSRTIALALRHGMTREDYHGIPKQVYIDNGKDYRCKLLSGKEKSFGKIDFDEGTKAIFHNLNVGVTYALPYNPQSKAQIERWFGTLERGWINLYPGYVGDKPDARPEKLEQEIKDGKLLSFIKLKEIVADALNAYHHRGHKGLDNKAPLQVFMENWEREDRIDIPALDLLLLPRVDPDPTIQRDGIHFNRQVFDLFEAEWKALIGHKAIVRFNPDDPTQINVTCEGVHFGWIKAFSAVKFGDDKELMKQGMALKRAQEKTWRNAIKEQNTNKAELDQLLRAGAMAEDIEIDTTKPEEMRVHFTGLEKKVKEETTREKRKSREDKTETPCRFVKGVA